MKKSIWIDCLICILSSVLYVCNRFIWAGNVSGVIGWFLRCYFNDILAGIGLISIANILLALAGWKQLPFWASSCLLLFSGTVWECFAPVIKPTAVFDPWDFVAYQFGGLLYWLVHCIAHRYNNRNL